MRNDPNKNAEDIIRPKKLKIALCAVNTRYTQNAAALDYLSGYLYKYLDSKNIGRELYELKIYEFNLNDTHEYASRVLCSNNADIYGFSTYIWNRDFITKLISFIRRAFPRALTLAGGPEVISVCRGESEAMCGASYAISGEGEISFAKFIELSIDSFRCSGAAAPDRGRLMQIEGMAHLNDSGGFEFCTEPAVVNNLDDLPSIFIKPDEKQAARGGKNFVYLETSRGCPNHCHYCLSSLKPKNAPAVRYFSLSRVFKDIDTIINVLKIDKIRVIDRTFNDDPGRALEIFKYAAAAARPETLFQFEISPYKFTPELLDYLKSLDRQYFQFEIGVQSFNKKALDAVGRVNCEAGSPAEAAAEEIKTARASDILDLLINETNVNIHADLMYGLPGDNYQNCISSFDELLSKTPDSVQFWQLKLLRGTKLRENAGKMGLIYDPNPPYAVIKTDTIDAFEMFKLQKLGRYLDLLYNHGHLKLTLRALFNFFKKPSALFFALIEYFERNDISETAISRQNLFLYIDRFGGETIKPSAADYYQVLSDCLRYDFIAGESKRFSLPDFLKPLKIKRDGRLYEAVREGAQNFDGGGGRLKLSKTFSLIRFNNDIINCASGADISDITDSKTALFNFKNPPARAAYIALKHIVNSGGTFETQKFYFNDPLDFIALDYFYFADKNKPADIQLLSKADESCEEFEAIDESIRLITKKLPELIDKFIKYGIIVNCKNNIKI
jgi:radical SAM superfamily enzyme YgiQ (UPF0313 family)